MLLHPTMQFLLAFVIVGLPAWSTVTAAVIVAGHTSDAVAVDSNRDGTGDSTSSTPSETFRTGLSSSAGSTNSQTIVFVFQLPTLGPDNNLEPHPQTPIQKPEPSRSATILLACTFLTFRRRRKPPPHPLA